MAEQFRAHSLFSEELVLVTAPGHRLARAPAVPLSALAGEPFICLPADSGLRLLLDDAAAADGCEVRVPFESTNLRRIRDLASHGLGVALLARSVAQAPGPPVAIHALAPTPLHRSVGLLQHGKRALTPAAEACRDSLIEWAGTLRLAK